MLQRGRPRLTPPRHQVVEVVTKDAGTARLPGIRLFYAVLLLDRSSAEASQHPQLHWLKTVAVNVVGERRRKAARGPSSVHQDSTEQGRRPNLSPIPRAVRPTCFIGVNHIDRVTAIACGHRHDHLRLSVWGPARILAGPIPRGIGSYQASRIHDLRSAKPGYGR